MRWSSSSPCPRRWYSLLGIGLGNWEIIAGLAIGGVLAAPLGGWLVSRIRPRPVQCVVGLLVIALSLRTLVGSLGA